MQPVGLQLLISPPLPHREADECSRAPERPGTAGWWDRGTASIPGPGGKLFSRCIHLKPPRALRGKRALSVFWHAEIAPAQISPAGAGVSSGAFHRDNNPGFLLCDRRHTSHHLKSSRSRSRQSCLQPHIRWSVKAPEWC